MTGRREPDGSEECSDPVSVGSGSGPLRTDRDEIREERRILTDGGEVQEEVEDAEEAEGESDEEAETEDEETEEDEESEEEPDEEAEEDEEAEAEDEEGEEPSEHVEDAEDVYEGDDTSNVLHLDLDGLFLDLLGLEVNLNPVTLDVSARPGEGNLVGNLLSAVTGLLDGSQALMGGVKSLLQKPKEALSSVLGKSKEALTSLVSKPREFVSELLGGDEGEDEEVEEEEGESEEDGAGRITSALGSAKDRIASALSSMKESLRGLLPSLPVEEFVATVVREILQALIEQLEPDEESTEETSQSEA